MTAPVVCAAELNYASAAAGRGLPTVVDIHDGRATDLPGWRECGFERLQHASSVTDWTDDAEIASVHYAEIEAISRGLTGCDAALVSDHVKRTGEPEKRPREQSPVRLVHSDFAAGYDEIIRTAYREVHGRGAATLARTGVTSDDIETARRIVMLQFWRNLGPTKMDLPLAWCDCRTVVPAEAKPFHYNGYVAGGRSFDAISITAPADGSTPPHAWYTFPELAADEVVVFRTYDTELVAAGRTWFTPHSAFRDPDIELGHPPRFSIELRVLCLWRG